MYKVLVVDDDEDNLSILGEYLGSSGVEFNLAKSAAQARKYLNHCGYDLVISDFQMPGESGIDLFRSVSFRFPWILFILMEKPFELSFLKRLIADKERSGQMRNPSCNRAPAA